MKGITTGRRTFAALARELQVEMTESVSRAFLLHVAQRLTADARARIASVRRRNNNRAAVSRRTRS